MNDEYDTDVWGVWDPIGNPHSDDCLCPNCGPTEYALNVQREAEERADREAETAKAIAMSRKVRQHREQYDSIGLASDDRFTRISMRIGFHMPVSDDDRTPLEFLTPVTERNTRGAGREGVLAGEVLAAWLADLHRRQTVDGDPYLAPLAEKWRRQVRAGLAFYRHEAARRAGDAAAAAGYLERYRSLVAEPAAN